MHEKFYDKAVAKITIDRYEIGAERMPLRMAFFDRFGAIVLPWIPSWSLKIAIPPHHANDKWALAIRNP